MALTNEINLQNNKDVYARANEIDTCPLAIEPYDREWGVGISGNTPEIPPTSMWRQDSINGA